MTTTPEDILHIMAGSEPDYVKELRARVERLETQLVLLSAQIYALQQPAPPKVNPWDGRLVTVTGTGDSTGGSSTKIIIGDISYTPTKVDDHT